MKNSKLLMIILAILFSFETVAHIGIIDTIPKKDAVLTASPQALSMTFSNKSRIAKLTLKTSQGDKVDFGFKPTKDANTTFNWSLPALSPETYKAEVIYFGGDGHKIKNSFRFTVR